MRNWIILLSVIALAPAQTPVPRVWAEGGFADWNTPIARQTFAAGHFSEAEYYAAPVDNLRTYPVYYPGREPNGYWAFINGVGPNPLIDSTKLKTPRDWEEAGRRVFEELDFASSRSYNPEHIRKVRSAAYMGDRKIEPLPDGTIAFLRWIVSEKGVGLTFLECAGCHSRWIPALVEGGRLYNGPPINMPSPNLDFNLYPYGAGSYVPKGDTDAIVRWRGHFVPWLPHDIHESMKTMKQEDWDAWDAVSNASGLQGRWDGSIFYPTKIPDLIGIKDRKYFDATATHRNRGIADIMRYAAQVSSADSPRFGPYDILPPYDRRVPYRLPDEGWYALALYVTSLQPPPNPNKFDALAAAGQKLFASNCAGCHTPPAYTNNKLTIAQGYEPTAADRKNPDVLLVSVGTDPGDALFTRKGTGFYKIPSLRGVWYRGHFLHDGSLASLEEMFNPARLKPDFHSNGWNPPGTRARAVMGHEFGLKLSADERRELIAFLKTL